MTLRRVGQALLLLAVFLLGAWAQAEGLLGEVLRHRDAVLALSGPHLALILLPGGLAAVTGTLLGLLLSRWPLLLGGLHALGLLPALVVLALAVLLLGWGERAAYAALWLLALLPVAQAVARALRATPPALRETAAALGLRPRQTFWQVQWPNTLPTLALAVRQGLAMTAGAAPLAALADGGGLGVLLFAGIEARDPGMIVAGAVPVILLALLCDLGAGLLVWRLSRDAAPRFFL